MAHRFDIPASRLPAAEKLVKRFARKAKRLGMSAPAIDVVREYSLHWITSHHGDMVRDCGEEMPTLSDDDILSLHRVKSLDMVEVEVTGERPVIAGWRFAAVIESTPAGNLLRKHPEHEGDLPERFRRCTSECDHCRKDRRRNQTYIVQHVESGEYMQVGRSCLKDFVGLADPSAWMATFEFERSMSDLGDLGDGGGWGFAAPVALTSTFLAAVAADIRLLGYTSSKQAREWDKMATGLAVLGALSSTKDEVYKAALDPITDEDRRLAADAVAWALTDEAGSSDYIHNVRICAAMETTDQRGANTLASLIHVYRKHLGRKSERASKTNEHLPGAVPETRLRGLDLTLVGDYSFETDYGIKWILRFEDADGRCVVWRTSSPPDGLKIGEAVTLDGTVKALGEYKGTKQTELSRCRIVGKPEQARSAA
jgi:hypothetical protein